MVLCHAVSDCLSLSAALGSFSWGELVTRYCTKTKEGCLACQIWLFRLQSVGWGKEGHKKGNIKIHHTALVSFRTDWLLIFHISVHLMETRDGTAKLVSITIGNLTGVMCLVWVIVNVLTRPAFKGRENKRSKTQNLSAYAIHSYKRPAKANVPNSIKGISSI